MPALTDPGIISLSNGGSKLTTHFRLDLFQGGVLSLGSGKAELSGGFAGSLATAIGNDPSLRIDASGATVQVTDNVANLIALADALAGQAPPLSLNDFFGVNSIEIAIDDTPANVELLLANPAYADLPFFANITKVTLPPGSSITLEISQFQNGVSLEGVANLTLRGTAAEVGDLTAAQSASPNPELLAVLKGFEITEGTLSIEAEELIDDGDELFFNPIGPDAVIAVEGPIADYLDANFSASTLITPSGGGSALLKVIGDYSAWDANRASFDAGGASFQGFQTSFEHKVLAADVWDGSDPIDLESVPLASETFIFEESVFSTTPIVNITGNFDVFDGSGLGFNDVLDISEITGVTTTDDTNPPFDFAFVSSLGGTMYRSTVNSLPALNIGISTTLSTLIEFDGLLSPVEGTSDFSFHLDNDVVGTVLNGEVQDGLTVSNFFGIPFIDQILLQEVNGSYDLDDIDIFRFKGPGGSLDGFGLDGFGDAYEVYEFLDDIYYQGSNYRQEMVFDLTNLDGDVLVGEGDEYGSLTGPEFDDYLQGGNGDDVIFGLSGDDELEGRGGDDFIHGGDGIDEIMGGAGEDKLDGGYDDDVIYGGPGDDGIHDEFGYNTIYGDAGNDWIESSGIIHGGDDNDYLNGKYDNDVIYGDAGDDNIHGDAGNDTIEGGIGDDHIGGGDGDDIIYGDDGDDDVHADDGNDTVYGGAGIDDLDGGWGNDTLYGDDDNDSLDGDYGNDILFGGDGDDLLRGGVGNDLLFGDAGTDTLEGGDGRDVLFGFGGADVLTGGSGRDAFTYFLQNSFGDVITDFSTVTEGYGDYFWLNAGGTSEGGTTTLFDLGAARQITANVFTELYPAIATTATSYGEVFSTPVTLARVGQNTFTSETIGLPHVHVLGATSEGYFNPVTATLFGSTGINISSVSVPYLPFALNTYRYTYTSTYSGSTPTSSPAAFFMDYLVGRYAPASTQVIGTLTSPTTYGLTNAYPVVSTVSATRTYLAFGLVDGKLMLATIHNAPSYTGEGWTSLITSSEVQIRTIASLSNYSSENIFTPNILLSNVYGLEVQGQAIVLI